MALPTSGAISLSEVNTELGLSATGHPLKYTVDLLHIML